MVTHSPCLMWNASMIAPDTSKDGMKSKRLVKGQFKEQSMFYISSLTVIAR